MKFAVVLSLLCAAPLPGAGLAITNARVWTGDAARPWAEAVLLDGNRIRAVGANAEVRRPGVRELDAGGRLVTPGLIDAHVHFLSGSLGLQNIDLTGICTLESMQRKVADYARAHPDKAWITGRGWEYFCFPGQRLPRKEDLDAVVNDRPVYLIAYDGHTGWANSKALERADINRATKFDGFGEIVKDETGEPTGCLKENAQSLIRRYIPQVSREEKLNALRQGMKLAASLGLTSIQNASGDEEELSLYDELLRKRELTVRASIAMSVGQGTPLKRAAEVAALKAKYRGPLLSVRAVKLVIDGVIESYTAAMLEPYANKPDTRGDAAWSVAEFQAMAAALDSRGIQMYTHAIGDRAVRLTLDAYEAATRRNGTRDGRHRVEHIETIDPADLPRFAKLGVIASMQPIHADPSGVDVWSRAVGDKRLPMSFAWRSVEKAQGRLVFSSDWPASISVNPMRGIHNAVNRRTTDGKPEGGWLPEQRVSLETALRGYTSGAAYASFEERIKGTIHPGMLADLVVWAHDLFRADSMRIHEARPVWTIFDGRIIYESSKQ